MEKFTDSTSDDFWIGANRLQTPGIWGWIDGSAFTFTDWDKVQPQNVTDLAYYTEADGSTYNNAAIGFYTEDDNAHWQWTDGTTFDFPNWSPPEPNNPGAENCGEIYLRSMDVWKAGQFNNIPCDSTIARYICKKPPL
uniref:C-type lectin domain-containing protein n=1 Tax=Panagrolaimus sp. PS1159 TaxID=55785 RepID=A0AC35G9N4_9BILA